LPTMVEEDFDIKFWGITVKANRIIEFDNYMVDPVIEDSAAIVNQKVAYNPDPQMEEKLFKDVPYPSRLSKQEREALIGKIENQLASVDLYKDLFDSESLARQAMKLGMEQRFGRYVQWLQNLANYLQYNRTEGLRLNYSISLSNLITKNSGISISAGYGISDERWKGQVGVLQFFGNKKKLFADANFYNTIGYEEERYLISTSVILEEEGLSDLPVITHMDFGHTDPMFVLPYGIQAEINCDTQRFTIVESAVGETG